MRANHIIGNFDFETLIGWNSGKQLMSLYGTEWRELGYGLSALRTDHFIVNR